jgi:hypothetical protein
MEKSTILHNTIHKTNESFKPIRDDNLSYQNVNCKFLGAQYYILMERTALINQEEILINSQFNGYE